MANYFTYQDKHFSVGSTIAVSQKIVEGGKERQQVFEGLLIKVKGAKDTKTFTVRKIAANQIGVERIWPVNSPNIIDIKLKKAGLAKRAKLYYIRDLVGKKATKLKVRKPKKIKEKKTNGK